MVHLVRTTWVGLSGGNGITQLAVDLQAGGFGPLSTSQAQNAVNAVRTFFFDIRGVFPNELTLTTLPQVDYYLNHNAQLAGSVSAPTPPPAVLGASTAAFAAAAGAKVNLSTAVIRNGRRVRGAIFLVPGCAMYTDTGTILGTTKTLVNTAGATMMSALGSAGLKLQVWSRPLDATQPKGPRDGDVADVTLIETADKTAILRGRRD